jgi:hypothetical protein
VDHGTAIYVLGADDTGSSDSSAAAHAFAEQIAAGRLPLPDVRFIHAVSHLRSTAPAVCGTTYTYISHCAFAVREPPIGACCLPMVYADAQGSPDARYAAARLAPALADPQLDRMAFYPTATAAHAAAGSAASPAKAAQVPPTEELTLQQWARYYRVLLRPLSDAGAAAAAMSRLQLPRGQP